MLAALLALSLLLTPLAQTIDPPWYAATRLPARGEVTFYGRGVMETTYHLRLERAQVPYCDRPACVGYIATLRPGDLGRKVWLDVPGIGEGKIAAIRYARENNIPFLGICLGLLLIDIYKDITIGQALSNCPMSYCSSNISHTNNSNLTTHHFPP